MKYIIFYFFLILSICSCNISTDKIDSNSEAKDLATSITSDCQNEVVNFLSKVVSDSSSYVKRYAVYPSIANGADSLRVMVFLDQNNRPQLLKVPSFDDGGKIVGEVLYIFKNQLPIAQINSGDEDAFNNVYIYEEIKNQRSDCLLDGKKIIYHDSSRRALNIIEPRIDIDYYLSHFEDLKYRSKVFSDTISSLEVYDENVELKEEPNMFSRSIKKFKYRDALIYLGRGEKYVKNGSSFYWIKVKTQDGVVGWLIFDRKEIGFITG